MQTILQVLKVNEARKGVSKVTGNPWEMQDCECILLNDDGSVGEVGVCSLPRDLIGKTTVGVYTASFSLRANKSREGGRRIEAVLTGLVPVPPGSYGTPKVLPASAPAAKIPA